ncbi:MAG: hypothetical protein QOI63_1029 [Thermoplasmata archaeon]|jgi:hypothetical protein|nr:hypothetical protein [Thermoplasmata archaeon]
MRALVAALLLITLLAGCFGKSAPATTPAVASTTTTAAGLQGLRANDTVSGLPAGFGGGFDVVVRATGFRGAQPSIGITAKGTLFADVLVADPVTIPGSMGYGGVIRSTDHGQSWALVDDPTHNPGTFDPMLWVDQDTGRVFSHHSQVGCDWMSISDDEGATWTPNPLACGLPFTDHQKIATGPYAPGSPLASAKVGAYPNLVTLCYNKVSGTFCAVSVDGGVHFGADALVDANAANPAVATDRSCGGINGHQKTAADGTIYVPYGYNCGVAFVGVSTDSGLTWTPRRLGLPEMEADPSIAITPDGTAYYLFRSDDQRMYLLRSHDRFVTHEGPFLVSPPDVNGTVLDAIVAGSDGRVAFAFLGHKGDLARPGAVRAPDHTGERTRWQLYVGMSLDAAAKDPFFLVRQATPELDPVQVGCISVERTCPQENLMFFMDGQRDTEGRAWFAFTDGCTSVACRSPNSTGANSRDQMVTVAHVEGPSLLADKGRLGPV